MAASLATWKIIDTRSTQGGCFFLLLRSVRSVFNTAAGLGQPQWYPSLVPPWSGSQVWMNLLVFPGDGVPAVPALCAQRPRSQKHSGGQRVAGENS